MKQRIFCIGDVHGHFDQLKELYKKILQEGFVPEKDILIMMGDMTDGGSQSKQVLDWCIEKKDLYPHWKFLFGNHCSLLLDALNPKHPIYGDYYLWWNQGGRETLESFMPKGLSNYEKAIIQPKDLITKKYLDFMKNLDMYYETPEYFFVHAGLHPGMTIEEHKRGVKDITPSNMEEGDLGYNLIWMREPFISSTYSWGKKIIFGHTTWPTFHPYVRANKIGIDTFMHNRGRLTAVILPEERFVFSTLIP